MSPEVLLIFAAAWAAFGAAAISPGPNLVAVASRALGSGRRSAIATAGGIATGAFFWAMLSALGLGALFASFPELLSVLGIAGGAYLLWLGFKGWRAALTGAPGEIAPKQGASLRGDAFHGLIVTITNPKVAMLWASLATFVGGATASLPSLIVFASGAAVLAFTIYGCYAFLFSTERARGIYTRFERGTEVLFGTAFVGLGAGLIFRSVKG